MLRTWFDSSKMDDMTTFEMTVIFDSDSEEAAVGAVDSLGDAFTEHLTGWAASIKSIWTKQDEATGEPANVRTYNLTAFGEHLAEGLDSDQTDIEPQPTKLIEMPEIIEIAKALSDQEETSDE